MKLTGIKYLVFVLLLTFLQSLTRGDAADVEVSCVFMESCILPCSFQPRPDILIHWNQEEPQKARVHSYYSDHDQLKDQDQRFTNRTSLFKDEISRGNASLQLTGVEVQDQGRYLCYTSSKAAAEESFIKLKVEAPVSKVDIQQEGNRITCSSEGIYPEPELTWSIDPPSNVTFENSTTVQQTEQQLYNIKSSLIVSENVTDLVCSCTVSTDRSNMTITLFKSNRSPNVEKPSNVGIIVGVLVAALVFATIGLAVYCIKKKKQKNSPSGTSNTENSGHESLELNERSETEGGHGEQEPDEGTSLSPGH